MDPHLDVPLLLLIPLLVAANAFFVAAEFALAAQDRLPSETPERDRDTRRALAKSDELALAAQLGSTAATLLLGALLAHLVWFGLGNAELAWLGGLFVPRWVGVVLVLATVVVAHLVLGEQIPRVLGIQRAEWLYTHLAAWPLRAIRILFWPLLAALKPLNRSLARAMGLHATGLNAFVHTPEEIRLLVARSHAQGVVEDEEREMIDAVLEIGETVAREVMTPRTDMVAVPVELGLDELLGVVTSAVHSRIPVYHGTLDSIVGVLLVKDLLPLLASKNGGRDDFDLARLMREPYFVPDTKPVSDILTEFRRQKLHLAIVLDEFGGTYGLVTMEDLLEEIVGDINDEYDTVELEYEPTPEGDVLIDGGALIYEVNERFGLELPEEDFDTIGGYIFGALGRVPLVGDEVEAPTEDGAWRLKVEEIEERRITCARLIRPTPMVEEVPVE
jgi:CBS domain containing-hemolysin-like protein